MRFQVILTFLLTTTIMLLLTAAAYAGTGGAPGGAVLDDIRGYLVTIGYGVVVGGVGWLVRRVSGWFKQKTGVDMEKRIQSVIDEGIRYAEEAARKYMKEHQKEWTSKAKNNAAYQYVSKKLKALKLPTFAEDMLKEMIESRLHELRDDLKMRSDRFKVAGSQLPLPAAQSSD